MKKQGQLIYASSERCADLLYRTGFQAEDPFFWLSTPDGDELMLVSELEIGRAGKQARSGLTILSYGQARRMCGLSQTQNSAAHLIAGLSRLLDIFSWRIPADFPYRLVEAAQASRLKMPRNAGTVGEHLTFTCPPGAFCPERAVKTAEEIERIREAQKIAQTALARGIAMLADAAVGKDGVLRLGGEILTSEILHAEVNTELIRNGGFSSSTIIAPGRQAADPHQTGTGPVHANEPIVFDIFPRAASGYFGDLSRTVLKGKAPAIVKKAFNAVRKAQRTVIETLKPGMTGRDVHLLAADILERSGFKTSLEGKTPRGFFHGLGHGVGLEIHESPTLSPRNDKPLEAGNVVTVEPGLYYPEWGGIRIEDTVALTQTGVDNLTTADIFLEID